MSGRALFLLVIYCFPLAAGSFPVLPIAFEQRAPGTFAARLDGGPIVLERDRLVMGAVTLRFDGAAAASRIGGVGESAPATYLGSGAARTYWEFAKVAIRG